MSLNLSLHVYVFRRRLEGLLYRLVTFFRKPPDIRRLIDVTGDIQLTENKIIWSTLVTSNRQEEVELADLNLRNLGPVLAWSSLTVDGSSNDLKRFIETSYKGGFDNLLWLTQPKVVSRRGYYASKLGHFNRISLNYLRGWLCNLEQGEEDSAIIFCHTDGDWKIIIRPESIEPLCRFFHERPRVLAISRPISPFLTKQANMWPKREDGDVVWYGTRMLSTNVVISPIKKIRPLIEEAYTIFPRHRPTSLEKVLGRLAARKNMVVAYPTHEYFKETFFIELQEKRKPFTEKITSINKS